MAQLTILLPQSILKLNEFTIIAAHAQQLFEQIQTINESVFDCLFRRIDSDIVPKAFVSVFVNDDQIFDYHCLFNDGDRVVFGIAIAGG